MKQTDPEHDLLTRVVQAIDRADFFRSIIVNDDFDDWLLAKELGEFLVKIGPELDMMGHALLLRAHRHLANTRMAVSELKECQLRLKAPGLETWEIEMFSQLLKREESLLETGGWPTDP